MKSYARAKWIVPMDDSPLKNGILTFKEGLISEIEHLEPDLDNGNDASNWSDLIILPGFINLHCHLDYSNVSFNQNSLFDWIEKLVSTTKEWSKEDFEKSAFSGARKALSNGTTFIVDSSYSGQSAIQLARLGLKGIVGLEIFGVDRDFKDQAFKFWLKRYQEVFEKLSLIKGNKIRLTISPHAPYTVSPDLFKLCQDWSIENGTLLLTHLAESSLENNWFLEGENRLDEYLVNVLPPHKSKSKEQIVAEIDWNKKGKTSFELMLEKDLISQNTLLAHCVHIQPHEISKLQSTNAKVAHCPRSNSNLSVGVLNLTPYLANQIPIGLGTDSLASTETLSMLDEARYLVSCLRKNRAGDKSLEKLALGLITIEAAKVANMAESIGSLTPGKSADFVILKSKTNLEQFDSNSIYSHLLSGDCQVKSVFIDGKCLYDNSKIATSP